MRLNTVGRRGIAPIVATLLLIVITLFSFAIAYTGTNAWINSQRSGPLKALQERFIVEDVWFVTKGASKYVCTYIRNIGTVEVVISQLSINGTTQTSTTPSILTLSISGGGSSGWMNATYTWITGKTYAIKVLTNQGSEVTVNANS